jgi:hypothetical protein
LKSIEGRDVLTLQLDDTDYGCDQREVADYLKTAKEKYVEGRYEEFFIVSVCCSTRIYRVLEERLHWNVRGARQEHVGES